MQSSPALQLAKRYHEAWTADRIGEAAAYLSDDLIVEVPINAYPSKDSFVEALGFTRTMVSEVKILSEFGEDGEALILYDMSLPFGVMRVAEHFSVSAGEFIVKLPRSRVDALVASGDGVRFDPGHGRLMKEWLAVWPNSSLDWERLADEALKFTSSG